MGKRFQINLSEEKLGLYSTVPYSMPNRHRGQRLKPTARAVLEKVCSLSNKAKTPVCRFTYEQLRAEYGRGHSTIGDGIAQLKELGLIKKIDRDCRGTEYVYVGETFGKSYYVIPLYLYTMTANFDGTWRKLTYVEVRVLGYLMTQCANPKNGGRERDGGGVCKTSYKAMAKTLGIAESSAEAAVLALISTFLVQRSSAQVGKNRFKDSGYTVSSSLYIYKRYAGKGKTDEEKENARAEYYAELRAAAERTKEKNVAKANRSRRFRELDAERRCLILPIAKAELEERKEELAALKAEDKRLKWEQGKVLYSIGLTLKDLTVQYVCKECSDTGKLKGGARCRCYPGD